jgi:hypothetical protein
VVISRHHRIPGEFALVYITIVTMSAAFKSTISTLESIDPSQFANDAERFQAKEALRKLLVRMETPFERIWALCFENPQLIASLRVCVDLGMWKKWKALYDDEGTAELTLDQIVALCDKKPETNLLRKYCTGQRTAAIQCLTAGRTLFAAHSSTLYARRDWS